MSATDNKDKILSSAEKDVFKRQYLKMRVNYENKIRELSIIKELVDTLRLTGVYDRNVLFYNQLQIVKKYTSLEQAFLLLMNDEVQKLELVANADDNTMVVQKFFLEPNLGTAGQVLTEKRPVMINDIEESCTPAEKRWLRGKSLLGIPVMHNDDAVGILALVHTRKSGFDQNDVNFFRLVADQVSTAVVLTRIYSQMLKEENKRFLLSRFFSKNVTDEILGSKGLLRLGGERKEATIMFADLHGFTAISERLDQEEVVRLLNAFFSNMTPIIFKNEGTLDKLLGDGMMAIFGAPISREDDPIRAIKAAIEMMTALRSFNDVHQPDGWPRLTMCIGVNTGEVVAGYIGSEDHLNYTVVGDAVNVAQRLQSIASESEILISKTVRDAIKEKEHELIELKGLTALPPQKVKGKQEAIEVFRVEY